MAVRLDERDLRLLASVAEHRVLRIRHAAVLHRRNVRSLRRRLSQLEESGLIGAIAQGFGRGRGRPERL